MLQPSLYISLFTLIVLGVDADRIIKTNDVIAFSDLIGEVRICIELKHLSQNVEKIEYFANRNKILVYDGECNIFGVLKSFNMNDMQYWCDMIRTDLKNNDYLIYYVKVVLDDGQTFYSKTFNHSRGPAIDMYPPTTDTETTIAHINIPITTLSSHKPNISTDNSKVLSPNRINAMEVQIKVQQERIRELMHSVNNLKEDLTYYKTLYESLYSLFENGTRDSTNWLILTGRTPQSEHPTLIVNEIIRDIVEVPLKDYAILKIERINPKMLKFEVRNYGEKLKILAHSQSKLRFSKFKILDFDKQLLETR